MPHRIHVDEVNGSARLRQVLTSENGLWHVMPSRVYTGLNASSFCMCLSYYNYYLKVKLRMVEKFGHTVVEM